jgi:hypothetical protein
MKLAFCFLGKKILCPCHKMDGGIQCYLVLSFHPFVIIEFLFIISVAVAHIQLKFDIGKNFGCKNVALWFYIIVSDHNDTDPIMQKS